MRLIRKTVLLAGIAAMFACNDLAAPPPLPADFLLVSINGRPLPTFWSPIPESPTILSSTIHLDGVGTATFSEHRLQMPAPGDVMETRTYTYSITGNQIAFSFNCPIDANCLAPPHGTISGNKLALDMSGGIPGGIIYDYRLAECCLRTQ